MKSEMLCNYSSILASAASIAGRAGAHPRRIKGKIRAISTIFFIGLVGTVLAFLTIRAGLVESEAARLLTTFLLFGSLAIILASGVAFLLVTYSAFVYQYVEALNAKQEANEVTQELNTLETSIVESLTSRNLEEKLEVLVAEELQDALPLAKGDLSVRVIEIVNKKGLGAKISCCVSNYLEESTKDGYLIKNAKLHTARV